MAIALLAWLISTTIVAIAIAISGSVAALVNSEIIGVQGLLYGAN